MRDAIAGKQRFTEFQKSLGLAKNIPLTRLKKLVEKGIFRIEPDEDSRKTHRYVLTPKGEGLGVVLIAFLAMRRGCLLQAGRASPRLKLKLQADTKQARIHQTALVGRHGAAALSVTPREINRLVAFAASRWIAGRPPMSSVKP